MHEGSCLCGAVRYVIHGEPGSAVFCHCNRCRKANGSAFASNAAVDEAIFELTQGQEALKSFSTPEGVHRQFCGTCGSPILSKRDSMPGLIRLRLGTLDTPSGSLRPTAHIFVGSKADWYEIQDDLPAFAERPTD